MEVIAPSTQTWKFVVLGKRILFFPFVALDKYLSLGRQKKRLTIIEG